MVSKKKCFCGGDRTFQPICKECINILKEIKRKQMLGSINLIRKEMGYGKYLFSEISLLEHINHGIKYNQSSTGCVDVKKNPKSVEISITMKWRIKDEDIYGKEKPVEVQIR